MPKFSRKPKRKTTAQALVEFGLALPIILLVVYGLIESGRLVFIYASTITAARQAARYGSVTGLVGSTPYYNDCAGIRTAAKKVGFLQHFADLDIQISYDAGPGGTVLGGCPLSVSGHPINGDRIRVQVSTQYFPIVPLVPFTPFAISSSSNRTLLIGVPVHVDVPPVILTPGGTVLPGTIVPPTPEAGPIFLTKSAVPNTYSGVGQTINYTYTINNQGSTPVGTFSVTDDMIASVNCSGATDPLAGGLSTTCSGSYVTTQADVDAGHVTNSATASAVGNSIPLTAQASLTINFVPAPHLQLTKSGTPPAIVEKDQLVSYVFTLQNTGNVPLTSPYGISDSQVGSHWSCAAAVSPLAAGASTTCTGTYALKQPDINSGHIDNTATATAKYGATTVTSNSASTTVLVPEISLVVTAVPTSVSALSQTITYTYTFTSHISSSAKKINISPSRGTGGQCVDPLAPGATASCTRTYSTYTQADMDAGLIINMVTADAEGNVSINPASVTVAVTQTAALQLFSKTAAPSAPTSPATTFTLPRNITYTYTLKNIGNVTLSPPYTVTDDKVTVNCTSTTGTVAPNGTKICTATYALTQADLNAGSIQNTASASAMWGAESIISGTASAQVITYTLARLSVVKSSSPTYFSNPGNQIRYSYSLVNTGGVSVKLSSTYTLMDNKVGAISCPGGTTLALRASVPCTTSPFYTVGSAEATAGAVINSVVPTGGVTTPSAPTPFATLRVPQFICDGSRLKHVPGFGAGDAGLSGSPISWGLLNNTGIPVHINAVYISWSAAPPTLNQVVLGGTTIWSGPASSSFGGFFLPGGPWTLPLGSTTMQLTFSAPASTVRIILTFSETACGTVDSKLTYPD